MTSVNTNFGALVALQQLNSTNRDLGVVQNRVSTGLRVSSARDDGAVFAIGQGQRARLGTIDAVRRGIDRANVVIDTGLTAGERIGNVLSELRTIAEDGQSGTFSTEQRDALQARFTSLRSTINTIANSATFNGANLINGSTSELGVSIADSAGTASSGSVSGNFIRGAAFASGTDEDTLLTTAITNSAADDTITYTLTDSDTGATSEFQFTITATSTIEDLIEGINTAAGGQLTLSFDAENEQLVAQSANAFEVTVAEATGTSITNANGSVITGSTTALASVDSQQFVAGGGYQATGGDIGFNANGSATLAELGDAGDTAGTTTFTDAAITFTLDGDSDVTGDERTVEITITGEDTIEDVIERIGSQTGGSVSARLNDGQLTFQSEEDFSIAVAGIAGGAANTAGLISFLGNSAAAVLAPDSSSGGSSGSNATTVQGFDFRTNSASGPLNGFDNLRVDDAASAATAAAAIDEAIVLLNDQLANLGAQGASLDEQNDFLVTLRDQVERGLGQLVDADLSRESARLQSLQVRQQLGAQALGIANQQPQLILSLFG